MRNLEELQKALDTEHRRVSFPTALHFHRSYDFIGARMLYT